VQLDGLPQTNFDAKNLNIEGTPDPMLVILEVKKILQHQSKVYIRCTNTNIIENRDYDCFGNGQVSFFCTHSMKVLCERGDLCLNRVVYEDNRSKVFEVTLRYSENTNVIDSLVSELDRNLYSPDSYTRYALEYKIYKNTIQNFMLYKRYLSKEDVGEENEIKNFFGIEDLV
jgi:hypothetical protein